jgi:hypothetical protein
VRVKSNGGAGGLLEEVARCDDRLDLIVEIGLGELVHLG